MKTAEIKAYNSAGDFIGVVADADFKGFSKLINDGLGECILNVGRKFDDIRTDLTEGNRIEIWISDKDTIALSPVRARRIYTGEITMIKPAVGVDEGIEVHCMGYGARLGLDVLKKATKTTLYTTATVGVDDASAGLAAVDIGLVVRGIIDRYRAENTNPQINYTTASVPTVSSNMKYTFEQKTYREGLDKAFATAPSGYFTYLDEDGLYWFKAVPTTPTHKFIFQKHFKNVSISRSIEKVRNFILIYDGNSGGTLYKHYQDDASIAAYGRRCERLTDPGIKDSTTEDLIGAKFIAENKAAEIQIACTIIDNNGDANFGYDIESIKPGDTCSLLNFNTGIAAILKENMIITSVEYTTNSARIIVEPIRLNISDITERLKKQLTEQTNASMKDTYS